MQQQIQRENKREGGVALLATSLFSSLSLSPSFFFVFDGDMYV